MLLMSFGVSMLQLARKPYGIICGIACSKSCNLFCHRFQTVGHYPNDSILFEEWTNGILYADGADTQCQWL